MKVLQIAPFPQRRGSEVFAATLNTWLEKRGHDVYTLYLYHYISSDSLRPGTAYTSALAHYRSRWEKLPGVNPRVLWFLKHTLDLFGPDIVQVNGGRALKYGALAKKFLPGKFSLVYRSIGSPHFWEKGQVSRFLARAATNQADGVVAVSDATLAEFGKGPAGQSLRRIHRGTKLNALRQSEPIDRRKINTPKDAKVLVYVGSLSFEKCPLRTLEILSKLLSRNVDAYLWVLGDGPQAEECQKLAEQLKIDERVRFLGTVQEVAPYLKASDLHILTSDTEGLPGCIVESSAVGIPCVAADVGGVREIVRKGETGFLVQPHDIDDYVAKIEQLLRDRDLYNSFSAGALNWSEHFSIDAIGPQYLELYRELIEKRS